MRTFLYVCTMSVLLFFSSCGSSRNSTSDSAYFRELARAGLRLGFDIEQKDNQALMIEAAKWIGTPYRAGGNDKRGVDCSGLTCAIYKNVYSIKLSRTSEKQKEDDCRRVSKSSLKSGDLVFFSSSSRKKKVGHVGIYLKEDKFIHTSSSKGVIVSNLNESYYKKHWISGGRVK